MLGCGNSTLSSDMYVDGYTNIVNIDVRCIFLKKIKKNVIIYVTIENALVQSGCDR